MDNKRGNTKRRLNELFPKVKEEREEEREGDVMEFSRGQDYDREPQAYHIHAPEPLRAPSIREAPKQRIKLSRLFTRVILVSIGISIVGIGASVKSIYDGGINATEKAGEYVRVANFASSTEVLKMKECALLNKDPKKEGNIICQGTATKSNGGELSGIQISCPTGGNLSCKETKREKE
jgi:hypothetical protein